MSVRLFDGSDDVVTLSTGAAGMAFGSMWAVLNCADYATGTVQNILVLRNGTTLRAGMQFSAAGVIRWGSGATFRSSSTALPDGQWVLMGITKTTGTTTPRAHFYNFGTSSWTHEDTSGTLADSTNDADSIRMGASVLASPGQFLNGRVAAMAVLPGTALSDGDFETLILGVKQWLNLGATAIWLTTHPTVEAIRDLTGGGADETAITGTTVDAAMSPVPLIAPLKYNQLMRVT